MSNTSPLSERSRKVFWTAFQNWLSEANLEELAELEWALAQAQGEHSRKLASHVSIAFNREVQNRLSAKSQPSAMVLHLPVARAS